MNATYLTKPFVANALLAAIDRALTAAVAAASRDGEDAW